jgi:hypothetical protein
MEYVVILQRLQRMQRLQRRGCRGCIAEEGLQRLQGRGEA